MHPEFSVVRQHEEFVWLHDTYVDNEEYAGLIVRSGAPGPGGVGATLAGRVCSACPFSAQIPPAPPRPDFEASREKLQKLGEGDSSITREEFAKMKQELEA